MLGDLFWILVIAGIINLVILYFIIKNAVKNGINQSKLFATDDTPKPDENGYTPVRQ